MLDELSQLGHIFLWCVDDDPAGNESHSNRLGRCGGAALGRTPGAAPSGRRDEQADDGLLHFLRLDVGEHEGPLLELVKIRIHQVDHLANVFNLTSGDGTGDDHAARRRNELRPVVISRFAPLRAAVDRIEHAHDVVGVGVLDLHELDAPAVLLPHLIEQLDKRQDFIFPLARRAMEEDPAGGVIIEKSGDLPRRPRGSLALGDRLGARNSDEPQIVHHLAGLGVLQAVDKDAITLDGASIQFSD